MVLALLAWAAMSLTRLVHGLGFGVEVGAAAPEIFARVLALVARATEPSTRLVRDLGPVWTSERQLRELMWAVGCRILSLRW